MNLEFTRPNFSKKNLGRLKRKNGFKPFFNSAPSLEMDWFHQKLIRGFKLFDKLENLFKSFSLLLANSFYEFAYPFQVRGCRGRDLNPQDLTVNRFWIYRGFQFRHLGFFVLYSRKTLKVKESIMNLILFSIVRNWSVILILAISFRKIFT